MNNIEKYNKTFNTILNIQVENISSGIDSNSVHAWDSITHLRLVTAIEDEFEVMFETEDILEFKSYEIGKEILKKYDINL